MWCVGGCHHTTSIHTHLHLPTLSHPTQGHLVVQRRFHGAYITNVCRKHHTPHPSAPQPTPPATTSASPITPSSTHLSPPHPSPNPGPCGAGGEASWRLHRPNQSPKHPHLTVQHHSQPHHPPNYPTTTSPTPFSTQKQLVLSYPCPNLTPPDTMSPPHARRWAGNHAGLTIYSR